jgi:hypothetical protein
MAAECDPARGPQLHAHKPRAASSHAQLLERMVTTPGRSATLTAHNMHHVHTTTSAASSPDLRCTQLRSNCTPHQPHTPTITATHPPRKQGKPSSTRGIKRTHPALPSSASAAPWGRYTAQQGQQGPCTATHSLSHPRQPLPHRKPLRHRYDCPGHALRRCCHVGTLHKGGPVLQDHALRSLASTTPAAANLPAVSPASTYSMRWCCTLHVYTALTQPGSSLWCCNCVF